MRPIYIQAWASWGPPSDSVRWFVDHQLEVAMRHSQDHDEAIVRRELKRDLRRRGIPFDPDSSTETLGLLQEAAHRGALNAAP